ncbi:hypothetical protein GALMADRAFT_148556 [Galerina marginata CBS 339.88]|uniref:Uncharacterized protein n=1 Tax=Galerina marginata (strain CBS 339.88) TaxID=685588 RepID=A0A067SFR7_GALM3|nr:hypothetical protein GALMADRAFT_148556 [Galerina marginata CBS 339.88]
MAEVTLERETYLTSHPPSPHRCQFQAPPSSPALATPSPAGLPLSLNATATSRARPRFAPRGQSRFPSPLMPSRHLASQAAWSNIFTLAPTPQGFPCHLGHPYRQRWDLAT